MSPILRQFSFTVGPKPPRLNVSSYRGIHVLSYTCITLLPLTLSLSNLGCKYGNIMQITLVYKNDTIVTRGEWCG